MGSIVYAKVDGSTRLWLN